MDGDLLTLAPHPDPSVHPLSHQWALRLAERQAEADYWEQGEVDDNCGADAGEGGMLAVPSMY